MSDDDIVARLRKEEDSEWATSPVGLLDEAADIIEGDRAEIAALKGELARVCDENKSLRRSLQRIASYDNGGHCNGKGDCQVAARAYLEKKYG